MAQRTNPPEKPGIGEAIILAGPTKQFFVSMITRDIELEDAILDLLDNCIDGVVRSLRVNHKKGASEEKPYAGYKAKITAKPNLFEIVDNCGGIDRKTAINYAFMLGRRNPQDSNLETIGMYGIGMKRAIFKTGRSATVTSDPREGNPFKVVIDPNWLGDDDNWRLPLIDIQEGLSDGRGTCIRVEKLYDAISRQFDERHDPFLERLRTRISYFFAVILEKGFRVELNGTPVEPVDLTLLAPRLGIETKSKITKAKVPKVAGIHPYVFRGLIEGVSVELSVGFYRPLASQSEIDEELNEGGGRQRSRDHAGWTVICNDRIVLRADKSVVTGWGVDGVPQYHGQFIAIAGVVLFRCSDSEKLPLTTTKRGIDANSRVYLLVRERMMEGLKHFTQFTNRWKGRERETNAYFKDTVPSKALDVARTVPDQEMASVRKNYEAKVYTPPLPSPSEHNPDVRISFVRLRAQVMKVAKAIFDDPETEPSKVGGDCFDRVLREVSR